MTEVETRLRDLLEKATKGPWAVHPLMAWITPAADLDLPICQMRMATDGETCEPQARSDAALIVEAVNALPTLLASLASMRETLSRIAAQEPYDERYGSHRPLRCRVCDYRGHVTGEERHGNDCAYVLARAALSQGGA